MGAAEDVAVLVVVAPAVGVVELVVEGAQDNGTRDGHTPDTICRPDTSPADVRSAGRLFQEQAAVPGEDAVQVEAVGAEKVEEAAVVVACLQSSSGSCTVSARARVVGIQSSSSRAQCNRHLKLEHWSSSHTQSIDPDHRCVRQSYSCS